MPVLGVQLMMLRDRIEADPTAVPMTRPSPCRPASWRTTTTAAAARAQVAYSVLPPSTVGIRRRAMSRTAPPPTAVTRPSRIAGSQPRPASSVFCAPTATQMPSARASTCPAAGARRE